MLYVTLSDGQKLSTRVDGSDLQNFGKFLREEKRLRSMPNLHATEVQADGHELEVILAQFQNIPTSTGPRVIVWKGEFARFIGDNL